MLQVPRTSDFARCSLACHEYLSNLHAGSRQLYAQPKERRRSWATEHDDERRKSWKFGVAM